MNIQIFGNKKSFDSKKAERWFKERRIKYQYIDLPRYGMSRGELDNVRRAVGGLKPPMKSCICPTSPRRRRKKSCWSIPSCSAPPLCAMGNTAPSAIAPTYGNSGSLPKRRKAQPRAEAGYLLSIAFMNRFVRKRAHGLLSASAHDAPFSAQEPRRSAILRGIFLKQSKLSLDSVVTSTATLVPRRDLQWNIPSMNCRICPG